MDGSSDPVSDNGGGVLFSDILLKSVICVGCSSWQKLVRLVSANFVANLEHIINLAEVKRISI